MKLVGKKWFDHHVETFIKPNVGHVPNLDTYKDTVNGYVNYAKKEENLKALLELWAEAKKRAAGRTILLPGRDAWLFEVVARLEDYPTIFRPDFSSPTSEWAGKNDPDRELFKACYGLDSGNIGSVPKALHCADFGLVLSNGSPKMRHQLIHHLNVGPYYEVYCVLEGGPKYWTHANLVPVTPATVPATQKIHQAIEPHKPSVEACAVTTMLVANYWLKMNPQAEATTLRRVRAKRILKTMLANKKINLSIARKRRKVV